ncbi:Transmembrane domain-containing protein [Spironucleus salmonicida]|uniref:Transmembrane domain-containing protein n=1 Tax=Spironucleus salmonicida TaxID=348837 RepID=V6LT30_9EUKA|nr:Transmembrane domain-containing protein [Spironucleus salmonicida]|eukprot:EST43949.1 Transmembrane domain-containing protein [Spironucleus salmonicida]
MSVSDLSQNLQAGSQKILKKTQLEFMSLGNRIDKFLSEEANVVCKAMNDRRMPNISDIRKAASSKTLIVSQKRVVTAKCILVVLSAFFFNIHSPGFSIIAWPGTILGLAAYSQYIIKTDIVGKRQRMPYESLIIAATIGMLASSFTGKSLFIGILFGGLVGLLSVLYRILDSFYRN